MRQEQQAISMKNERQKTTIKAEVGKVIAIQMDSRDIPHPNALLGVAFDVPNTTTGGCRVVTLHGIISKSGNKPYYIPKLRYNVTDDDVTIAPELLALKEDILNGTFDEKKHPKITLQRAHGMEYGTVPSNETPIKVVEKLKPCKCTKGCGKNCRCRKMEVICSKECGCAGKCQYIIPGF